MKKRDPITHIMSTQLYTLNVTNNLMDAKKMFDEHHVRHIPVVSGSKIIGMLSYTDFMRATYGVGDVQDQVNTAIYHTVKLEQVMTRDIVSVSSDSMIREVAELLAEKGFHAVPVVDSGNLKGIVTTTDIIKYLLEQY